MLTESFHAVKRAAQRNVSAEELEFIVENGKRERGAGVIFCQLRRKDVPDMLAPNDPKRRLIGTTVVLCKCSSCVVTVYRDPRAFQRDRRKAKYDRRDHAMCPCCGNRVIA